VFAHELIREASEFIGIVRTGARRRYAWIKARSRFAAQDRQSRARHDNTGEH